ncbi:MAG: hypothetical protein WC979_04475 [Candidatus Pacearchaeota archaeon]|jgi:hypothetical protein
MLIAHDVHNKIIETLKKRGPSLPIQIAKEVALSSLFVSAFLSELVDDKRVKVSSLKVGGSPLYFLEGQEEQLEKFHKFLHPKESEAFLLLKSNKLLKDSGQDPAIRVALRAIKDFSYGFKIGEDIYWRYLLVPEQEITELISSQVKPNLTLEQKPEITPEITPEIKTEVKPEVISIPEALKEVKSSLNEEQPEEKPKLSRKKPIHQKESLEKPGIIAKPEVVSFENPFAVKTIEKPKKEKPKSKFVLDLIKFIEQNNWKLLEEKEHKAKEYSAIVQVDTELGPIAFLTLAKDKKSVSDTDLNTLLRQAQSIPLPALFIYNGNLNKKALEYQQKYYSILKVKLAKLP